MKVIAAMEIALYDIKGKWLGVPVYELHRRAVPRPDPAVLDPLRVVPRARRGRRWAWRRRARWTSWIALVDDVEKAGFRALKTNLLDPGSGQSGLPPTLDGAIDTLADQRRRGHSSARCAIACGPDMGILFDVGQEYRMGGIVQLARALEPFNLYWLEAEGFDPDALLAARQQTRTRLCHGEALIRRAGVPAVPRDAT